MALRRGAEIGDTVLSFDVVSGALNSVTLTMQRAGVSPVYILYNQDGTTHTRFALSSTELTRTVQIRPRITMPTGVYSTSQHGGLRSGETRQSLPSFSLYERD